MATQCFLLIDAHQQGTGDDNAKLNAAASAWSAFKIGTARGSGSTFVTTNTVAGATNGVEVVASGAIPIEWISDPLDQAVTISGTITVNLWGLESSMNANVALNVVIERLDSKMKIVSQVAKSANVTELGTSNAVQNFTVAPTSTNFQKGDRIRIRIFGDDAGTMGTGFTFNAYYHGATADAAGDTYVTFTETFGFITGPLPPNQTKFYLRDTTSFGSGKKLDLTRGSSTVNSVTNTAAGWTAGIQITASAGGSAIEWYTAPLNAFTLSGLVRVAGWGLESAATANASIRAEIAVTNGDGSNAVVYGAGTIKNEMSAAAASLTIDLCGADISVTAGQRIRIRIFVDDNSVNGPLVTGLTTTFSYDGTTDAANGDAWIQFNVVVTEQVASGGFPKPPPLRRLRHILAR